MGKEVKKMKKWRSLLLFALGGGVYCGIELLWRGRTYGSMFVLGGACFVILGRLGKTCRRMPLLLRALMAASIVTVMELLCGLIVNRSYGVWDYRQMPLNFLGQICLPFFAAWMPLGLFAMWLYGKADNMLKRIM